MKRVELAKLLVAAGSTAERRELLAKNVRLADERLADEMRKVCYASWSTDPVMARRAADAVKLLLKLNDSQEIRAAALWVTGISDITKGRFQAAVASLDNAATILADLGRQSDSAQAQVAKLLALAMVGNYDEAVRTGDQALGIFAAAGDDTSAGKIEMNLSNIMSRQSRHREAEQHGLSARRRFLRAGEKGWLAMSENDLANTYAELNDFRKAERYYQKALTGARTEKMFVTEAEIEASLGNLALLRGDYGAALRYLETSRRKYEELGMEHQSAIADLEIADIYSEFNLLTEAVEIYERVSAVFRRLKLRAEQARSQLSHGRAAARLSNGPIARRQLAEALRLFSKEGNRSGEVTTLLAVAELALAAGSYEKARELLARIAVAVRHDDNPRHIIGLGLLEGEVQARTGDHKRAFASLSHAYAVARSRQQVNAAQAALNALGKLSAESGDTARAKFYFTKAVRIVETLRSTVVADEFSMAFLSSRLEPFENLANLLLREGKIARAFNVIESGRSRALLDAFERKRKAPGGPAKQIDQIDEARAELNFYYKKLDRASDEDTERLRADIKAAETKLAGVRRQISSLSAGKQSAAGGQTGRSDLKELKKRLGNSATLIEFIESDGEIGVFVVDANRITFVRGLGTMSNINVLLEDLHFQFGAMRYGSGQVGRFMDQMKARTNRCLMKLYDQLLRPIEKHLSGERLIVVPAGALHYVPFHALHDGDGYIAERFETSYAPSAAVWANLAKRRPRKIENALLIGYADERIPLVEREIAQIRTVVPDPTSLVGNRASFAAFLAAAPDHDLIHMACHGHFRPENPMLSSLHLSDGWVTVQDICSTKIKARLVTLSACETGVNMIFAGDEILGLARGFLSAGAASLVVSLWTVNDEAAGRLMKAFYINLQRGRSVSSSLRSSQLDFIRRGEHPFLWSPFVSIGG